MKYIVYITTNLINGKKYIGSHSMNIPSYLGSGVDLTKDIKFYGKDNFKREILKETEDYKSMRELEEYYCTLFNVKNNPNFYNKTNKGVGAPPGFKMPESAKLSKSLKQKGKPKHSKESKRKIGDFHKGKDNFGNRGKKLSNEYIEKLSKGKYKPILQYDLNNNFIKEWDSATTVAIINKWNRANIHDCCRGKQKTSYNFIWKYKEKKK